ADRLGMREEGALRAQGIEVRKVHVIGAVFEELVVGELVEDDPDDARMIAWRLRQLRPRSGDLVGSGLPAGDPDKLRHRAAGKDHECRCEIAQLSDRLVVMSELAAGLLREIYNVP